MAEITLVQDTQTQNTQQTEVPKEALSSPALLFLYYRIEQIIGMKASGEALINLNEYLEQCCHDTFVNNPSAYEHLLTSREQIYKISKYLTVNETYFFREGVHFEVLSSFLPQFQKLNRPLQICSAATSIGCEAYSIAMLLNNISKGGIEFDFIVDAFDVDGEAIDTAKKARYTANTLRNDGSSWRYILDSYITPDKDEYVVNENIRRRVRFFPHNIMRGLDRKYDIIFFRNALIYFSNRNRHSVLNNLTDALYNNGYLFLGVSETSSAKHHQLANRFSSEAFYFQKVTGVHYSEKMSVRWEETIKDRSNTQQKTYTESARANTKELPVTIDDIASLLEEEEGKPNALKVLNTLKEGENSSLTGSELTACAIYYLTVQNYEAADTVLTFMEKYNNSTFTRFLRAEYYYQLGNTVQAESLYQEAAGKNKSFWPAFYRIAALAADGERVRYEYKLKKAIESIDSGKENKYECFMGGFSPDYFRRILEKKLS